jgi:hypothetical protein
MTILYYLAYVLAYVIPTQIALAIGATIIDHILEKRKNNDQ